MQRQAHSEAHADMHARTWRAVVLWLIMMRSRVRTAVCPVACYKADRRRAERRAVGQLQPSSILIRALSRRMALRWPSACLRSLLRSPLCLHGPGARLRLSSPRPTLATGFGSASVASRWLRVVRPAGERCSRACAALAIATGPSAPHASPPRWPRPPPHGRPGDADPRPPLRSRRAKEPNQNKQIIETSLRRANT